MSERLFILTGASRGLGAAMAAQLVAPGHVLLCIARHDNTELLAQARSSGARLEQWNADLAEPAPVARRLQSWLATFDPHAITQASLINNAGVLTKVGPLDECDDREIAAALRVGLEAPMLLSAAFLRATREWAAPRRVPSSIRLC